MSSVKREDIERIAQLAALHVDAEALPILTEQIGKILEYVSQLEALDTGGATIGNLWLAEDPPLPLRTDEVQPASRVEDPQGFAPAFREGLFVVPKLSAMGDE